MAVAGCFKLPAGHQLRFSKLMLLLLGCDTKKRASQVKPVTTKPQAQNARGMLSAKRIPSPPLQPTPSPEL